MLALRSPLLTDHGFRHGFSTALGAREPQRLFGQLGVEAKRLFQVDQVHGRAVVTLGEANTVAAVRQTPADALVASVEGAGQGVAVAVRTADCVPLLIADPRSGGCAAVHAGWRGAVAGVVHASIDSLCANVGARCGDLLVAIGPHIRVDAFEIGEEVAEQMVRVADGDQTVVRRDRSKPHGDLAALLRKQLHTRGVGVGNIDDVGGCTWSDSERFFSYRRSPGELGRQLSLIVACASRGAL